MGSIFKLAQTKLPLAPLSMALTHMQLMSIYIEINLKWPPEVEAFMNYVRALVSFNLSELTSPECVLVLTFTQKWVISIALPASVIMIILVWSAIIDPQCVKAKVWWKQRKGDFNKVTPQETIKVSL